MNKDDQMQIGLLQDEIDSFTAVLEECENQVRQAMNERNFYVSKLKNAQWELNSLLRDVV